MDGRANVSWLVEAAEAGRPLGAFLRSRLPGRSWSTLKEWVATGKVLVDGDRAASDGRRLRVGQRVELRLETFRPSAPQGVRLVYEDSQLVVIDKPAGVPSVRFEERERGTAMDLVRDAWRRKGRPARAPLFVVHRIDKATSGLLVYAKTKRAERALAAQFRAHQVERTYLCVAHGNVPGGRIESSLVRDRGDGLRGSVRRPGRGKLAVTQVKPLRRLAGATLCEVRLETGKTHQIRIHLAERGHPLVGEKVYGRGFLRQGGTPLDSPRLLLHAATLGFEHPVTGERLRFESSPPEDFLAALGRLAG